MTTKPISDEYAAALIEAHGMLRTNTGGRQRPYRPNVTISTPDPHVAQALRGWGGGKLDIYSPKYDPDKVMYSWTCRGQAAVRVLQAITPYLVGDKASHAKHILQRQQERTATA
jgi:hypothetical protein